MIYVSQSLISRLFFKGEPMPHCPRNIKEVWLDKKYKTVPTAAMLKGQYGETLCLGSTAYDKVVDLPRKALTVKQEKDNRYNTLKGLPLIVGDKTTDQRRIDEQAIRFKQLEKEGVFEVYGTQVKLMMDLGDDIVLGGILDMFPFVYNDTANGESFFGVGDLKMAQNIDNSHYLSKYPWGDFASMDKIQAVTYLMLLDNIDNPLNEEVVALLTPSIVSALKNSVFVYVVFEWGSKMRWRPYVVKRNDSDFREGMESIRRTKVLLSRYSEEGWPESPDVRLCEKCPIMGCNQRLTTVVWE